MKIVINYYEIKKMDYETEKKRIQKRTHYYETNYNINSK